MSRFKVAGPAAAELAVAIQRARDSRGLLGESTLDRFRRIDRRLALATSFQTDSATCAGG